MNKNSTPSKAATRINESSGNEIKFLKYVKDNPKFKKLTPEQQQQVMGRVYDKHVAPWYQKQLKASGVPNSIYRVPTREEWLKEQSSPTKLRTSPDEASHEYAMSAVKGAADMAATANKFIGFMFGHNRVPTEGSVFKQQQPYIEAEQKAAENYIADHQVNSLGNALLRGGAEMLPQLPLFEFGEGALSGLGLTKEVLETYKEAKPLKAAALGFLTSLATGHNIKESGDQAVGFAAFDLGGEGLAKLGNAGLSRAKSLMGRLLVLGGPKSIAAMMEAGERWLIARGGEDVLKAKISAAASSGTPLKISDPLGQAGANILNAFAKQKFNRYYNFLGKDQKLEVMRGLATYVKTEVPAEAVAQAKDNPQAKAVVTKVVQGEIERQAKASPEFAKSLQELQKLGINVVANTTDETVENAAVKSGRRNIPKVVQNLAKGTTASAEKSKSILNYVNDEAKRLGRPGPGAATINDPVFFENLRHIVANNYKLESEHQQLIQLWGLRNEFPKEIQALIKMHMERVYPAAKGYTSRTYNQMVENQEKLLSDVATGMNKDVEDIKKHGARLFRSHDQAIDPLSGKSPNRFTRELEQKAEVARIKAKVKNHPDAAKAVDKATQVLRQHNILSKEELIQKAQQATPKPKPGSVGAAALNDPKVFDFLNKTIDKDAYAFTTEILKPINSVIKLRTDHPAILDTFLNKYQVNPNFKDTTDVISYWSTTSKTLANYSQKLITGEKLAVKDVEEDDLSHRIRQQINGHDLIVRSATKRYDEDTLNASGIVNGLSNIINNVKQAPAQKSKIFRGMLANLEKNPSGIESLEKLKVGDSFNISKLSSFTDDLGQAIDFGSPDLSEPQKANFRNYMLVVQEGSKAFRIHPFNDYNERELVSFGQYQVVGIKDNHIFNKQGWRDKVLENRPYRVILLKHIGTTLGAGLAAISLGGFAEERKKPVKE